MYIIELDTYSINFIRNKNMDSILFYWFTMESCDMEYTDRVFFLYNISFSITFYSLFIKYK